MEPEPEGSISFADFDYGQQAKSASDMSIGISENLFAADQTPTPTRLIKNCDEVGLFEDLQHVNPFDIGFQRAAEQNAKKLPAAETAAAGTAETDSLHTPQVYALEGSAATDAPMAEPVPNVEELLRTHTTVAAAAAPPPTPVQLIQVQPQLMTWIPVQKKKELPAQTVRPYILPKPSSASLTPTSQLPIKERLKAILNNSNNNNSKRRSFAATAAKPKTAPSRSEDSIQRHRAAASRYREKMRGEHKNMREQNAQLQQQIRELRERVATLERELLQHTNNAADNQIQIPPSTIHLVINVPKMIVPTPISKQSKDIKK
ncbi:Atf-2 [Drosophila busckii]|uniref:Atf-2 n=1 Tax=Drosophila busckii TaxID=30019 RepID=A0A0M3QV74_DROBS|nr:cyclic AMP-dependent transcription factor ATF-2 [Drosophila busckii]ALC41919.1 Atf-2 [Drosophila busckii]